MSPTGVILQAHWRALLTTARQDTRMRIVLGLGLIVQLALVAWGARALDQAARGWEAAGRLDVELLWLLLQIWVGMGTLALLSALRTGFDDEALLLLPLPLPDAARFRALYGVMLLKQLGSWLPLLSIALLWALGWRALAWLPLLLLGIGVAVLVVVVAVHLIIAHVLPRGRGARVLALAAAVLLAGLLAIAALRLWGVLSAWAPSAPALILPLAGALVAAVLLGGGLGPLAERWGALYMRALLVLQSRSRGLRVRTPPGVRALVSLLERRRTPAAAIVVKELLSQSRNPLNWIRVAMLGVWLLPFPWLRERASEYGLAEPLLLVGYMAGLALLSLIDTAPSPLGGEGERLALYLAAPLSPGAILWAKLAAYLPPLLVQGLLGGIGLGLWSGLPARELLGSLLAIVLLSTAAATVIIWGSVWDADLSLPVEGEVQTLIVEQLPSTPRRIWLINAALLVLVLQLGLLWLLPPPAALVAQALSTAALLALLWRLAQAYLQRLTRG